MNHIQSPHRSFDQLQRATTVVLLFQAAFLLAQLIDDRPTSNGMVAILAATLAASAANRRVFSEPRERHTRAYLTWWRYGSLALLAALTVLVALDSYAPGRVTERWVTVTALLAPSVVALKGAALGKLRPNRFFGLRLPWTVQSRLAWELAHRSMGRILFFGGLIGVVAAPFVPVLATFVGLAALVLLGVAAGAIEGWRAWRDDPERSVG